MSNYPPAAPPPPAYGAGGSVPAPRNGLGIAALVLGILSLFCLGFVGGILAVIFGRMGMKKAEQGLATNGGVAKAGFILGIIGIVLSVIYFIYYVTRN